MGRKEGRMVQGIRNIEKAEERTNNLRRLLIILSKIIPTCELLFNENFRLLPENPFFLGIRGFEVTRAICCFTRLRDARDQI